MNRTESPLTSESANRIPTQSLVSMLFLGSLLSLSTVGANAQVTFFGVGDLSGGIVQSEVQAATRVGGVVYAVGGSSANAGSPGNDTAFLWTSTGGMTALPDLAAVPGATTPEFATAITPNAAYIASQSRFNPASALLRHAVRVTTSGLTNLDLGTLTGFPQFSTATAISDDGTVLYGYALHAAPDKVQAVRYTAAGPTVTAIPFLNAGDDRSVVLGHAISSDGAIAVGTSVNSAQLVDNYGFGWSAFRYVHGTGVAAIPMLPGGTWNAGIGVSPNGNLALVGGDTPELPLGEAYLYNAGTATTTVLGTPLPGWKLFGAGGMTSDGAVVALTVNDPDGPLKACFVHNSTGWHDVQTIVAGAGVDLAGWTLNVAQGISNDGVRVWGSAIHNGNMEGWVAEFPAGYLAAYGASAPAPAIVGSWTGTDTTKEGAEVIVFLANGTYFDIADARTSDAPTGFDGYERGTYTWDPVSKALTITTVVDTDGDYGPSGLSGLSGITANVVNSYLTVNFPAGDGDYSTPLVTGTSPIVGGWVFGDSTVAGGSALVVFFANGTYLLADDTGPADVTGQPGMERGTYNWDSTTGAFAATALADTDGARGLSHLVPGTTAVVVGSTLTLTVPTVGAIPFTRVQAAPTPPTNVVSESRKFHAAAGVFDLVLGGPTTNPTTEPRFGPTQNLVFIFDKPVTGGIAAVTEGTALAGTPTFSGSQMTVPLTGVANQQYVTLSVSSVTAADGGTGGTGSIRVGFLAGDVSQNRVVTLADLGQVNAQVAQQVTTGNFLKDVNASGTLSLADKGLTNTQLTKSLPPP